MSKEGPREEEGMTPETVAKVAGFFIDVSTTTDDNDRLLNPPKHSLTDFVSGLITTTPLLPIQPPGRLSFLLSVHPAATNAYGGMHGGAVASVAETVSLACARTVVGQDKDLFLGELSMSYLSAAPRSAELRVDASVTRSGRNLTVVAAEFRLKDSGNLTYTSRATFYNMPISSL